MMHTLVRTTRCIGVVEMGEWRDLMASLEGVMLIDESDKVWWKLE